MTPGRGERIITALDIGSSKVCALIALSSPEGDLRVLGTSQRESRGVQRGFVVDKERTVSAIREAVDEAERIAGVNAEDAWVSFSAGGLSSEITNVEVELGGHRIEQDDVDRLMAAGQASIEPKGRTTILHAQPALYTVDGQSGFKKPLGLHADRLGVTIHVVAAETSPIRNLDLCVRSANDGA